MSFFFLFVLLAPIAGSQCLAGLAISSMHGLDSELAGSKPPLPLFKRFLCLPCNASHRICIAKPGSGARKSAGGFRLPLPGAF